MSIEDRHSIAFHRKEVLKKHFASKSTINHLNELFEQFDAAYENDSDDVWDIIEYIETKIQNACDELSVDIDDLDDEEKYPINF